MSFMAIAAILLVAAGGIAVAADSGVWTEPQLKQLAADIAKYASETRKHYEVDPAEMKLDDTLTKMATIYAKEWGKQTLPALRFNAREAWVKQMQEEGGVSFDYVKQVIDSKILINRVEADHLNGKTIILNVIPPLDKNAAYAPDSFDDEKYCKRLKNLLWKTTTHIGAAAVFLAAKDGYHGGKREASNRYVIFLHPGRKRNEKEVKGKLSDAVREKLKTLGCNLDRDLAEEIDNAEFASQVLSEVNKLRKRLGLSELKTDDSALSAKVKDFATAWALEDEAPKAIPGSVLYADSNHRDTARLEADAIKFGQPTNVPLYVAQLLTAVKLLEKFTMADETKQPLPALAGSTTPAVSCPRLKQLLCSDATKLGVYAAGYEANYDFPYRNYYYALAMDADCKTPKFSQKVQEELKKHKCAEL